jgi:hypothetical protein
MSSKATPVDSVAKRLAQKAMFLECFRVFDEKNAKLAAAEAVFAEDGNLDAYIAAGEGFIEAHDAAMLALFFSK